jgi:hypothetical protein
MAGEKEEEEQQEESENSRREQTLEHAHLRQLLGGELDRGAGRTENGSSRS